MKTAMSGFGERLGRFLARAARVDLGPVTWEIDEGPWFDNQVGPPRPGARKVCFSGSRRRSARATRIRTSKKSASAGWHSAPGRVFSCTVAG